MKKFNIFVIMLLTFFVGLYKVNASGNSTCMYEDEDGNLYKITLSYSGEYVNDTVRKIKTDGSDEWYDFGLEVDSAKFKSLMKNDFCPSKYVIYDFNNVPNSTQSRYGFAVEDNSWSVDESTGTLSYDHNGYDRNFTLSSNFKKYYITKTSRTSYSCEASASSGQLSCCYKNGDVQFRVNVYETGVNGSSAKVVKMDIVSSGKTSVKANQITTYFSNDGKSFKNSCPSSINSIITTSKGTKYYYLYFDSDYKTSSNYNTNLSSLEDKNGKQVTYTQSFSLSDSDGKLELSSGSTGSSGHTLTSVDGCTTSSTTSTKVCCYKYTNGTPGTSNHEEYLLKIKSTPNNSGSVWQGATLTFNKITGTKDFYLTGTEKVSGEEFKYKCPDTIYGYAEKGPGQTIFTFHLYTKKATRDSDATAAHTAAQSNYGTVRKTTNFDIVNSAGSTSDSGNSGTTDSGNTGTTNPDNSGSTDSGNNGTTDSGNTGTTDPGYTDSGNSGSPYNNEYENTHGKVDLSDDPNYRALPSSGTVSCGSENLGIKKMPVRIVKIINAIISVLYIGAPIILIILGMIDFGKGVLGQKEDEIEKGKKIFVKRLIAALLIFIVVIVVKMLVRFVNTSTDNQSIVSCIDCFISGTGCTSDN